MKLIKYLCYLLFLIALILLVLIFTSANDAQVTVNFFFGEYTGAFSFILGCAFVLGFLCALVVLFLLYTVIRTKLSLARRKVHSLEAENRKLRTKLEVRQLDGPKTLVDPLDRPVDTSVTKYPAH